MGLSWFYTKRLAPLIDGRGCGWSTKINKIIWVISILSWCWFRSNQIRSRNDPQLFSSICTSPIKSQARLLKITQLIAAGWVLLFDLCEITRNRFPSEICIGVYTLCIYLGKYGVIPPLKQKFNQGFQTRYNMGLTNNHR